MKKIIKFIKRKMDSDKGGIFLIAIAVILAFVSFLSSFSMIFSAQSDFTQYLYLQDIFQEELLLRSENMRTNIAVSFSDIRPIPDNQVEVVSASTKTQYNIENQKEFVVQNEFMGFPMEKVLTIKSLISARRGIGHMIVGLPSPIKRYCERLLNNESLARYQYFTNKEASENADGGTEAGAVHFWGNDSFDGKVFSNDDIWIQDTPGGWPTFNDFVGTAGIFRYYPGGQHLSEVVDYNILFPHGWAEHADRIMFYPQAIDVRQHGIRPFDGLEGDIVRVHIDHTSYVSMIGKITLREIKDIPVMSWFPKDAQEANAAVNAGYNWFTEEDTVWVNHIPVYDTTWTEGPSGNLSNGSIYIKDKKLWIDGVIQGKQTWACSDTVYIVGDITYVNTQPGHEPDNPTNPNRSDYFGLISEQRIYIKYKFRDPLDNMNIHSENCNDIYLYGAYAALGQGDKQLYGIHACHYDGIFSYEYQHPHGSTPDYVAKSPFTGQDTLYKYVDLHKFIFPKNNYVPPDVFGFNIHGGAPQLPFHMCGYPFEQPGYAPPNHPAPYQYPYGTDYPWYNPIWPESAETIVTERGTIHNYGAIHQTRRGYIHRSGSDPYNHPPGNDEWEFSNFTYHFDGPHPSTGYHKDYHYDKRFLFVTPPDYPKVYKGLGEAAFTSLEQYAWFFKQIPDNFK